MYRDMVAASSWHLSRMAATCSCRAAIALSVPARNKASWRVGTFELRERSSHETCTEFVGLKPMELAGDGFKMDGISNACHQPAKSKFEKTKKAKKGMFYFDHKDMVTQ